MIWYMIFCAWDLKAGGCQTPTSFRSKAACEFVLGHQRKIADEHALWVNGRCVGVVGEPHP